MTYSVYNYQTKKYDYFWSPESVRAHAPKPPTPSGVGALGSTPDQAAWPLPYGAKKIGSGDNPRGRIATSKGAMQTLGLGEFSFDNSTNLIAMGGLGYLVWRFFFRKD